ncbi:MAG: PQQ-dependent sugar dehydrogenase [Phycisphaerales bacterium]
MHRILLAASLAALLPLTALAQSVERLWNNNCASCHGRSGEGGGAGTRSLLTDRARAQDLDRPFFDAVRAGVPDTAMPGFSATLTDRQMWGLIVHLRELQHRHFRESGGGPSPQRGVYTSTHHAYTVESIVSRGPDIPWALDWLPTGEMLITERPGTLRVFSNGKLSPPAANIPKVLDRGQGGLMEVAVHPHYDRNGFIFLAYSHPGEHDRRTSMTRIVRGKLSPPAAASPNAPWTWSDETVIFQADQSHYVRSDVHFGCRIAFDPTDPDILFFSHGERGHADRAQDLARPNGKILRVRIDGSIPDDNPFRSRPGALAAVWSFGHRNPQGLVFDLKGNLWDTEHGPRGGDELNLILPARNYGWPIVSLGIEYSDAPFRTPWQDPLPANPADRFVLPTYRWLPSIGACGLDVCRPGPAGEAFPQWRGDLIAGGLSGNNVDRLRVGVNPDGSTSLIEHEELLVGVGRVRDVATAPDGSIYVILNGPDKVIRLAPVKP